MADVSPNAVGARLRLVQRYAGFETVDDFAGWIGVERNRVSNWINGYNLIPVPIADRICEKREVRGLTLDWLYRGVTDALTVKLAIAFEALAQELDLPDAMASPGDPGIPRELQDPTAHAHRRKTARNPAN